MRRPLLVVLSMLPVLPLGGCCTMARFFCGPDTSPWVSQRFDAPEHALRTLLEAIRRDNADVVYLCLAPEYKQRLGLDALAANVAWQRLRDATPGLHLAGYAAIPRPDRIADDGATFTLDVEGRKLQVALVRQAYWQVRFLRPDGSIGEQSAAVTSLNTHARVERLPPHDPGDEDEDERSSIDVLPLEFRHAGVAAVPLDRIEQAGIGREWKVADLKVLEPR